MLTFDEAAHRYFWQGRPVQNVTAVLSDLTNYSMVNPAQLEIARQKGVAVHKMVELHCKSDLDEEQLPDWMRPVLQKWIDFVKHTGFKIIASEQKVYHPIYRYAGTLDLFGFMEHIDTFALIDLKRSFMAGDVIALQLAAYRGAYAEEFKQGKNAKLFGLRLREDAPPRLKEFTDPGQFGEFVALLTANRIKEKYAK